MTATVGWGVGWPGPGLGSPAGSLVGRPLVAGRSVAGPFRAEIASGVGWPGLIDGGRIGRHRRQRTEVPVPVFAYPGEESGRADQHPAPAGPSARQDVTGEGAVAVRRANGARSGLGWPLRESQQTAVTPVNIRYSGRGGLGWPASAVEQRWWSERRPHGIRPERLRAEASPVGQPVEAGPVWPFREAPERQRAEAAPIPPPSADRPEWQSLREAPRQVAGETRQQPVPVTRPRPVPVTRPRPVPVTRPQPAAETPQEPVPETLRQPVPETPRQPVPETWPRVDPAGEVGVSRETAQPIEAGSFAMPDPEVIGPPELYGGARAASDLQAAPFDVSAAERPARTGSTAIDPVGGHWRPPDGPMISGSYSGAASAQAESEEEVANPGAPDTSADTPIARAAQAAMNARSVSKPWPRPRSCRILTIANQKGGVGKTTSAVNLAASLAMHGSRVLVVDLDPQGNASTALDVEHRSGIPSIYNVLVDGLPLANVVRPVHGFPLLRCAPATIDLAGAEIELVPLVARESRLVRAVAEYDASNLDYILIDCPPSLGLLTVNALVAAPEVLIPIQCEYYALEGLEQLLRTVELVKSHLNPGLKVTTILLTMFDSRTRLASQVADEVRSHFGSLVLNSVIPRSVRVSEAPSYGQSVMTYDPGSSGAVAYLEAAREMAFQNSRAATA
jgi:chromosome partitioning protein